MPKKDKQINKSGMKHNKNKKKKQSPQKPQPEKKEFNCLRCGYCCIYSTPSFTKEEYKKVRDLKETRDRKVQFTKVKFDTKIEGKNILQEYSYFTKNGLETLNMNELVANLVGGPPPCEFLDKDENGQYKCAIYPYRPSVCKDFGVKEWECPNNPDYLKKVTKGVTFL